MLEVLSHRRVVDVCVHPWLSCFGCILEKGSLDGFLDAAADRIGIEGVFRGLVIWFGEAWWLSRCAT